MLLHKSPTLPTVTARECANRSRFCCGTDEPNELVAPYHDCMPVVLGDVERWLNLDTTLDDVDPLGPERFAVRAVNPAVNKVSEKNIGAIEHAA
jgi:putative SOS response-associated peptidase YedK